MRRIFVECVLFLVLLTFCQKALAQEIANNPAGCGVDKIQLGTEIREFIIPDPSTAKFTEKTKCTYQITSPADTKIEFSVTTLNIGPATNCEQNYIKAADSLSLISTTSYFACGDKPLSYPFKSKSNEAAIVFQVTQDPEQSFVKGTLKAVPLVDPACGPQNLTLQSSSAELKIPYANKSFTAPTACLYFIKGNDDKNLSLEITSLTLGDDGQCSEDFIKVSNSFDTLLKTNYTYCGTKAPKDKFFSSTNELVIGVSSYTKFDKTSITVIYSKVNFVSKLESSTMVVFLMLALVAMC